MKETRSTSRVRMVAENGASRRLAGMRRAAHFALCALTATLAACAPEGDGAVLSVRTLEVSVTGADGQTFQGGAIDSTWTIPGDDVRRLTRSLVLEPGHQGAAPNRLVDLAVRGLVTGFDYDPPSDPPGDATITENESNGLLEISLQPGIIFRATVLTDYLREEDLGWRGEGEMGDRLLWIDRTVSPPDTVRLTLDGNYEDARDADGGREAVLRAEGVLYVATGGEFTVQLTERVSTTVASAEGVTRMMGDAGGELVR